MVFNATFNNNSVILWWSVLFVKDTGVPRENHLAVAGQWQTLSHNVVSSTPRHEWGLLWVLPFYSQCNIYTFFAKWFHCHLSTCTLVMNYHLLLHLYIDSCELKNFKETVKLSFLISLSLYFEPFRCRNYFSDNEMARNITRVKLKTKFLFNSENSVILHYTRDIVQLNSFYIKFDSKHFLSI
jgi:hypothetical protein